MAAERFDHVARDSPSPPRHSADRARLGRPALLRHLAPPQPDQARRAARRHPAARLAADHRRRHPRHARRAGRRRLRGRPHARGLALQRRERHGHLGGDRVRDHLRQLRPHPHRHHHQLPGGRQRQPDAAPAARLRAGDRSGGDRRRHRSRAARPPAVHGGLRHPAAGGARDRDGARVLPRPRGGRHPLESRRGELEDHHRSGQEGVRRDRRRGDRGERGEHRGGRGSGRVAGRARRAGAVDAGRRHRALGARRRGGGGEEGPHPDVHQHPGIGGPGHVVRRRRQLPRGGPPRGRAGGPGARRRRHEDAADQERGARARHRQPQGARGAARPVAHLRTRCCATRRRGGAAAGQPMPARDRPPRAARASRRDAGRSTSCSTSRCRTPRTRSAASSTASRRRAWSRAATSSSRSATRRATCRRSRRWSTPRSPRAPTC